MIDMKDLDELIDTGPKPDLVLSIRHGDHKDIWFECMQTAGLIRRSYEIVTPYWVEPEAFGSDSDPRWELARTMWTQRVLGKMNIPPPAQRHSEESVAAAHSMLAPAKHLREVALDHLRRSPMTDSELAISMGLPENTARPRRVELAKLKLVVAVGKRKGPSGRYAKVWGAK